MRDPKMVMLAPDLKPPALGVIETGIVRVTFDDGSAVDVVTHHGRGEGGQQCILISLADRDAETHALVTEVDTGSDGATVRITTRKRPMEV